MTAEPALQSLYDVLRQPSEREVTFDPSVSPLHERVVFVVGAPRSGTTWLQQLLLVHPLIATGGESHLFCEGLPAIFENFANRDVTSHLSTWVCEGELLAACRSLADGVFTAMRDGSRPAARMVLEKTPNHRQQSSLQARLYPDARYVHIVRDGRDSAASQHALWKGLSGEFAVPARVAEGWAQSVNDVRGNFGDLHYMELRYEDVLADVEGALATIFDHLGLPHDASLCAAAAQFGRAPVNVSPSSTTVKARKHAGNVVVEREVARAGGPLLVEFGYAEQAEVERMARRRTPETFVADALLWFDRARSEPGARLRHARERFRRRRYRSSTDPAREVGTVIADALEASDATKLGAVLDPAVRLAGATASGATASGATAAEQLIEQFGGYRAAHRRPVSGTVLLTLVDDGGQRAVLRIAVARRRAVSIEVV